MAPEVKEKHNAIEKALMILSLFTPNNQEMGTNEISQILGFHKATVSRTLLLLTRHGYLQQNRQNKKFKLGMASLNLGMAVSRSLKSDLVQIAVPYMDQLRDELQESVVLEIPYGENILISYVAEGPRRVRLAGNVGDTMALHAAAGAKAILAFTQENISARLAAIDYKQLTANTITTQKELEEQLSQIRQEGVAFDLGEQDLDVHAVAVPILNMENVAIGALIVAGIAKNIDCNPGSKLVESLKSTATAISQRLFYP